MSSIALGASLIVFILFFVAIMWATLGRPEDAATWVACALFHVAALGAVGFGVFIIVEELAS